MTQRCDVAVIGGGPAGTATALALRRSGLSIVVLESSKYDRARVGETLPPVARMPLSELRVWERFISSRHRPSPGNVSAWGQAELYEDHFIFSAYGHGWHLDRVRFDEMLAVAARDSGATVHRGAHLTSCVAAPTGDWQVGFTVDGVPRRLQARFLVDATGRASSHARRQGARRLVCDGLIGIAGSFAADAVEDGQDGRTLVEACDVGWWYSAGLPSGQLIVVFMTDADLWSRDRRRASEEWRRRLAATSHTRARVADLSFTMPLGVMTARTSRLDPISGPRWLAVGDAALTFDPLSSHGITTALQSGLAAGRAIDRWSNGRSDAFVEYEGQMRNGFDSYLKARTTHYGRERRWPDSTFWRRRHAQFGNEAV
jgi:flavin-dependent dehydrogenase